MAKVQIDSQGKVYTSNGKALLVQEGSGTPVIESLSITPTTSSQTIAAQIGVDGYSPVTVSAVTSSIDSNIQANNIKKDIQILGVTGTVTELNGETRTATLTSSTGNTFTPSSGKNAIISITITPNNQARSVTPSTSSQTLSVNSGYSGNGTISVSAVTSSIDANIQAGNIKKDVQILGVTGTYDGSGGGIGIPREIKNGMYQMPSKNFMFSLPSNATDVDDYCLSQAFYKSLWLVNVDLSSLTKVSGQYGLSHAFYNCTSLTSVDLSSLTTISGRQGLQYALNSCTALTSVDLSSLTTVSGNNGFRYALSSCTALTSVNLSSLTTVSGDNGLSYALNGCTALTSVNLSSLTTVSGNYSLEYIFSGCAKLTSVDLSSLTTVSGNYSFTQAFGSCTRLTDIYFRALTTSSFGSFATQFYNMMSGTGISKTHTIHFPSNMESTIQGLLGYPNFGGTSGYIVLAYDLPATS